MRKVREIYGVYDIHGTVFVFIPCFKWNKQYFVQTRLLRGSGVAGWTREVGRRVARGEELEIRQEDLEPVSGGWPGGQMKRCPNCGYTTDEDFTFCPKCGGRF